MPRSNDRCDQGSSMKKTWVHPLRGLAAGVGLLGVATAGSMLSATPAGTTAPTAQKLYTAAVNTGMGNQTVSASFRLSVPGNTFAGTYTSTWTYSLVSAP